MRIVQLSDTHVTHLGGLTTRHLDRVIDFVNASLAPDLVVHTGDLVALDADAADDRRAVHELLARLAAPVRVLPGNHDVGDTGAEPWMGRRVTPARVRAFRETYGADRWLEIVDQRWALAGIDSQVLGSGLAEEEEQFEWLEEAAGALGDRAVLIFLHKPLWAPALKPGAPPHDPDGLSVPAEARDRILDLFGPGQVAAVANGHLHRSRTKRRAGLLEVWAPATAFVARQQGWLDAPGPLGVVEYRLDPDGLEVCCWQVPGAPEIVVDEIWDIPELRADLERMGTVIQGGTA